MPRKETNETREASKKDTKQAHYGSCQLSHAFLHLTFAWSEMNLMRVEVNFKHIKAAFPFGVCFRAASLRCFSASDVSLFSRESRSFDEFFLLVIRFCEEREPSLSIGVHHMQSSKSISFDKASERARLFHFKQHNSTGMHLPALSWAHALHILT